MRTANYYKSTEHVITYSSLYRFILLHKYCKCSYLDLYYYYDNKTLAVTITVINRTKNGSFEMYIANFRKIRI